MIGEATIDSSRTHLSVLFEADRVLLRCHDARFVSDLAATRGRLFHLSADEFREEFGSAYDRTLDRDPALCVRFGDGRELFVMPHPKGEVVDLIEWVHARLRIRPMV